MGRPTTGRLLRENNSTERLWEKKIWNCILNWTRIIWIKHTNDAMAYWPALDKSMRKREKIQTKKSYSNSRPGRSTSRRVRCGSRWTQATSSRRRFSWTKSTRTIRTQDTKSRGWKRRRSRTWLDRQKAKWFWRRHIPSSRAIPRSNGPTRKKYTNASSSTFMSLEHTVKTQPRISRWASRWSVDNERGESGTSRSISFNKVWICWSTGGRLTWQRWGSVQIECCSTSPPSHKRKTWPTFKKNK